MKIKDSLPLTNCYDCKNCVLRVKEQTTFYNGETQKQLVVKCRNFNTNCFKSNERTNNNA